MLESLASHNPDIERLRQKGYALSFDSNYLVVRDIPYLDNNKALQQGAIVSKVVFIDNEHIKLEDHQIFFCGTHPCQADGSHIRNFGGGEVNLQLSSPDLVVQRSFSNKPATGYVDFFDKIETYVTIISGPAIQLFGEEANPLTFRAIQGTTESVFKFHDTLTSRAEIGDLALKFKEDVIAIIGLGGTGSFLLDFLIKTPIKEIRAFDFDKFHIHNAFRCPGKLEETDLGKPKAEVYQSRYDNFRNGLSIKNKIIQADSTDDLEGVTFAFVSVDKGTARKEIFDLLLKMKIPFIDVGMGLERMQGLLSGIIRTTYFSNESAKEIIEKNYVPMTDLNDEEYRANIQISELNALNACLAVIKFKQIRGFYVHDNYFHQMLFTIDTLSHLGE